MQVSVESPSPLKRQVTIDVPAEKVDGEVDSRLADAAKRVRLDGFRPGKVPMRIVRQRFGAGVRAEVLSEVMNQTLNDALVKESLTPAGRPSVEPLATEQGSNLKFVATFEVYPQIDLCPLSEIEVIRPAGEVTDADIDQMIETIRSQQAKLEVVERPAQSGDTVTVDYSGSVDGEAFDGGQAEGAKIELGAGRMIPGFEDGILGMAAGEEKVIKVRFPDDYGAEHLAGKEAEFNIKVTEVAEKQLPALDQTFFDAVEFEGEGVDAFRAEVRANMERELGKALRNLTKTRALDAMGAAHSFEIPEALVAEEINQLRRQLTQQFGGAELPADSFPDDLFRERAEKRVTLGLLMAELVKQRELQAEPERVRAFIEDLAQGYQDAEAVVNWYYQNPQMLSSVESAVLEDQAVETVLSEAQVSEETLDYTQVMQLAAGQNQ